MKAKVRLELVGSDLIERDDALPDYIECDNPYCKRKTYWFYFDFGCKKYLCNACAYMLKRGQLDMLLQTNVEVQ